MPTSPLAYFRAKTASDGKVPKHDPWCSKPIGRVHLSDSCNMGRRSRASRGSSAERRHAIIETRSIADRG